MADTLFTINNLAADVGAAPQTLYNWREAGLIEPRYKANEMPLFTPEQRDEIARLVKERKAARTRLRLAPSES